MRFTALSMRVASYDAVPQVMESQNGRAVALAVELYASEQEKLRQEFPMAPLELEAKHQALEVFHTSPRGNSCRQPWSREGKAATRRNAT